MTMREKRVLAIASAGGHWLQLNRLAPAWDGCDVTYVTTKEGYRNEVMAHAAARGQKPPRYYAIAEANRWQKFRLVIVLFQIAWILLRVRPDIVISTGAAPGGIAISLAALMRARTVWIDSIANAETLSMSGQKAGAFVDLWLTQWQHLSDEGEGPRYRGRVV